MMTEEDEMNNWRQFQGTELGGLMAQIYGNQNKPKINYPKPLQRKSSLPTQQFIPGGAKSDAVDPRKATRRNVEIDVPVPRRNSFGGKKLTAIDVVAKRRSADVIKTEIDEIRMKQEHYRPAHVYATSSEQEKERLSQIFTFKGGKGLPNELTHPVGQTPMELAEKRKEEARIQSIRDRRAKKHGVPAAAPERKIVYSESEQLINQISSEIDERKSYLDEMKTLGVKVPNEPQIRAEISRKVAELKNAINDA